MLAGGAALRRRRRLAPADRLQRVDAQPRRRRIGRGLSSCWPEKPGFDLWSEASNHRLMRPAARRERPGGRCVEEGQRGRPRRSSSGGVRSGAPVARTMLWPSIKAPVAVVVSQVPRCVWVDAQAAAPADGLAGAYGAGDAGADLLMVPAVTSGARALECHRRCAPLLVVCRALARVSRRAEGDVSTLATHTSGTPGMSGSGSGCR